MPSNAALPKVLVVEDEALLLFSIADELRDAGYEVLEASNADEAVDLLNVHSDIALVFTDIDMPGSMDGLKLSNAIHERWPPVRVVLTSGKQRPADDRMPPGTPFLPKPYTTSSVVAALRAVL